MAGLSQDFLFAIAGELFERLWSRGDYVLQCFLLEQDVLHPPFLEIFIVFNRNVNGLCLLDLRPGVGEYHLHFPDPKHMHIVIVYQFDR